MTITPDAPQTETRMIDGIPLTPKEVTTIGFEDLVPKATIEEERLHRKQRLAGALRIFGRFGIDDIYKGQEHRQGKLKRSSIGRFFISICYGYIFIISGNRTL